MALLVRELRIFWKDSRMKNKVCIIGHFGGDKVCLDGQTIKTKIITAELKKQLGENQVNIFDTYGGKKTLLKCFFKAFSVLKNNENIIMLPAHNGVRFFTPVLLFWNIFFHRKLHYSVIGGWLPKLVSSKKSLCKMLKRFNYIYVETNTMKQILQKQGFENVSVIPNCKELQPLTIDQLVYNTEEPYKLCTFSRVNRLKGVGDAVDVIKKINTQFGKIVFKLDIYGRIDDGEEEWFNNLVCNAPAYINYCGQVSFEKSVDIIKNYFALLFPTKYYTEGIPGTIIDAYAAGVPVISSRWESFSDIIDDGITGKGVEFNNDDEWYNVLIDILKNIEEFNKLKINCIKKSACYLSHIALRRIIDNINNK